MLQLALTSLLFLVMVIPAGMYLYHIAAGKHTLADLVFDRVDNVIYKIGSVHPQRAACSKLSSIQIRIINR